MQERVDGITARLAFTLRSIPGLELEAYQAYVESTVNSMLQVCACVTRAQIHLVFVGHRPYPTSVKIVSNGYFRAPWFGVDIDQIPCGQSRIEVPQ